MPRRLTTHDWAVDQLADLFRTTHKVKTQQVVKSRGQFGPVSLVLDLRVTHARVGSSADPALNGHLRYPNNLDKSLNDVAADKIWKYRADYNNNPPSAVSFMTASSFRSSVCAIYLVVSSTSTVWLSLL